MPRKYRPHQCPTCQKYKKEFHMCAYKSLTYYPSYLHLMGETNRNCKDYDSSTSTITGDEKE